MRFVLGFIVALALSLAACRKDDSAANAALVTFRAKFDQVREGWTQAEVREFMGDPVEVQIHTAAAAESVETARGTIAVHQGDSTTGWTYKVGAQTYVIEFAPGDDAGTRPAAVYWKALSGAGARRPGK